MLVHVVAEVLEQGDLLRQHLREELQRVVVLLPVTLNVVQVPVAGSNQNNNITTDKDGLQHEQQARGLLMLLRLNDCHGNTAGNGEQIHAT